MFRLLLPAILLVFALLTGLVEADTGLVPANPSAAQSQSGQRPPTEIFHDIRGPVTIQADPTIMYSLAAGIGLLLILLAILGYRWWKGRDKMVACQTSWERALAQIDELQDIKKRNEGPLFTQRLTALLRQYIEERFALRISSRTSSEFLSELKRSSTLSQLATQRELLTTFLGQADMVKFARAVPDSSLLEDMETTVRRFIQSTIPAPEENS